MAEITRAKKTSKILKYFGKVSGRESLQERTAEARELTDKDVDDLYKGIEDGTLDY